jgi:hypothetical protein
MNGSNIAVRENSKKMIYVFSKLIKDGLNDELNNIEPALENGTIIVQVKKEKLVVIKMVDLGTDYNLSIDADNNLIVSLEDLFFDTAKVQLTICEWIKAYYKGTNHLKIAKNKRIVDYLNQIFNILQPIEDCKNEFVFKLNGIHPEIVVRYGDGTENIAFGVRDNGACFVLRDIETEHTIVVNYTDYLVGNGVEEHLKKWLTDRIIIKEEEV